MRTSLFGYFFGMITVLTAAVMLLTSLPTISTLGNGRHNSRPAIARTPKTTAMGTHWVMLNLGTARAVSFSADLARARLDSLDRRFLLSGHVVA